MKTGRGILIACAAAALACAARGAAGGVSTRAPDPRETFARANRLYEAGKYAEAKNLYERLVRDGYSGANLYYNIGNACVKLDRKGEAILYYRKALALRPRDQDARSNLDYARSLVRDRIEAPPRPWPVRRWNAFISGFTARELLAAAAVFYWGLVAVLVVIVYAPGARRPLSRAAAVLLALLLVAGAGAFCRFREEGRRQAVVLASEATVRYGPSEKDVPAFVLHEGAEVEIRNERGGWCQIALPDGKAGWVEKTKLGIV